MKYYVYAGYYENFISGHKLPKPYTLRDEFKTFNEALDYVWENWEDDDIFFTKDVIDDAIDNGVINDENWKDYLMEESKKSTRKSMKESTDIFDTLENAWDKSTMNNNVFEKTVLKLKTDSFKDPFDKYSTIYMFADGSSLDPFDCECCTYVSEDLSFVRKLVFIFFGTFKQSTFNLISFYFCHFYYSFKNCSASLLSFKTYIVRFSSGTPHTVV